MQKQEQGNAGESLRGASVGSDGHGGTADGDTRVYPGAPKADAADGGAVRRLPKPALAGLALSLLLIACAVGYFAVNPGSIDAIWGSGAALQTTEGSSESTDGVEGEQDGTLAAGTVDDAEGSGVSQAAPADASGDSSVRDTGSNGLADAGASSEAPASSGGSTGAAGGAAPSGQPGAQAPSDGTGGGSQEPAAITVRVVVDSSAANGSVSADTTVTFEEGATAYDALCSTGLSVNARDSGFGVYVAGIGGLAEFDYGGESGWKYSVNGSMPGYSSSSYTLHDGDVVRWVYATSL